MKRIFKLSIIFVFIVIIYLILTQPLNWDISDNLGNGYMITSDKDLFYKDAHGYEYNVLPFGVSKYAYDRKWIIVCTKDVSIKRHFYDKNKDSVNYWIINKEIPPLNYDKSDSIILYINNKAYPIITNGLIGPMDSLSFIDMIKKYNIPLKIN